MDMVRKLILEKLAEKQLSMKDASLKMGRAHSYLYQFLKRGIPLELHERDRMTISNILDIPQDELRGPSTTIPRKHYSKNNGSRKSSVENIEPLRYLPDKETPTKFISGGELFGSRVDFPLYGTVQGGRDGALIMSATAVDWIARPSVLLRVTDAYGIIVTGDSMAPEHKAGSVALVNPHLPPRVGDSCVFQCHAEDGTTHGMIKEFRGETESHWKVRQHTPPRDFSLTKSAWQIRHRVVGNYSP